MLPDNYTDGYNIAKELLKNPELRNVIRTSIMKLNSNDGIEGFLDAMEDHTEETLHDIITKTKSQ